jgi:hypothetical protein
MKPRTRHRRRARREHERGRINGPRRGQTVARRQRTLLWRTRDEPFPDAVDADLQASLWSPLLGADVLSLDVQHSSYYLYPDAGEATDADDDE